MYVRVLYGDISVWTYVCIKCACMYACMCICICICACVYVNACMKIFILDRRIREAVNSWLNKKSLARSVDRSVHMYRCAMVCH